MIRHPELLNEDTVSILKRLLNQYPYYQTARLLLLQNMYKNKDPLFQKELRRSAVLINDRKVLFNMIEGLKYHITPQQASQDTMYAQEDKDRTLTLIESFLETMPSESDNSSARSSVPVDATTDYMAYLMQDEETTAPRATTGTRYSQRINLEDNDDELSLPEEDSARQEDFFTESLAQIYIKQQKYERALEIIRSLSADNPKKNSYFADQIRFLEKIIEINNKNK